MGEIRNIHRKFVYKYMNHKHAIQMIKDGVLWFSLPEAWEDSFESIVTTTIYDVDGVLLDYPLRKKLVATCFAQRYACEAQWKAYSRNPEDFLVQVKFDYDKLLQLMKLSDCDFYVSEIKYQSYADTYHNIRKCIESQSFRDAFVRSEKQCTCSPEDITRLIKPLSYKYNAFEYEGELRFFAVNNEDITENGVSIKIPNIHEAIESICIDPQIRKEEDRGTKIAQIKDSLKQEYSNIAVGDVNIEDNDLDIHLSSLYRTPKGKRKFVLSNKNNQH